MFTQRQAHWATLNSQTHQLPSHFRVCMRTISCLPGHPNPTLTSSSHACLLLLIQVSAQMSMPSLDALVDVLPLTSHPSLNLVVLRYGLHSTHHSVLVCLFMGLSLISCIFSASALESPWRQKRNLSALSSGP